jgi:hypothetical protein
MATESRELSRELVRLHLEARGYLPAFGVTVEIQGEEVDRDERTLSRADHEIDVVAVRIAAGRVEAAIVGIVKGYWTPSGLLSPSMVRNLEKGRHAMSRGLSEARLGFVRGRFGLGQVPFRKVLFYSLRSPTKSAAAERMLAAQGIEVIYLEDVIAEVLPRMATHPFLASGTALQAIRALRRSDVFERPKAAGPGMGQAAPEAPRSARKPTKRNADEPQLDLFAAAKG